MATAGPTKTEAQYRRLLAKRARSGKTMKEFAAECGAPEHRLWWWKGEIRRRDATRSSEQQGARREEASPSAEGAGRKFVPVRVVEALAAPEPEFQPSWSSSGYELVLGGERVLRLPRDFDPVRVGALLRAVEASC